jgi:RHS repeat-associated protein
LTGLTYKQGATTIGALAYGYDTTSKPTSVGGSWARSNLPAALASATYDEANQIVDWAGTGFVHDLNGNLTSDGTRSYAWNARNELISLSGPIAASFGYDARGRRRSKTIGGMTTQFVYDVVNTVQELAGDSPVANFLTGLSIDETFTRTDAGGTNTMLSDVPGSTLALTNSSGTVQTSYSYEPFGRTNLSGATTTNAAQFTGRENDSTGLYFYRARLYNPELQRFISEDPMGFAGGLNLFTYAANAPTVYADPLGLKPRPGFGGGGSGGMGSGSGDSAGDGIGGGGGGRGGGGRGGDGGGSNGGATSRPPWGPPPDWPPPGCGRIARCIDDWFRDHPDAFKRGELPLGPGGVRALNAIKDFLGPGARTIRNSADDLIAISRDGTRRVRFDINNPHPHQSPHTHVEWFSGGRWRGTRVYPPDVVPR